MKNSLTIKLFKIVVIFLLGMLCAIMFVDKKDIRQGKDKVMQKSNVILSNTNEKIDEIRGSFSGTKDRIIKATDAAKEAFMEDEDGNDEKPAKKEEIKQDKAKEEKNEKDEVKQEIVEEKVEKKEDKKEEVKEEKIKEEIRIDIKTEQEDENTPDKITKQSKKKNQKAVKKTTKKIVKKTHKITKVKKIK